MSLLNDLKAVWGNSKDIFLFHRDKGLAFADVIAQEELDLSEIKPGDVVGLIGDFNPESIAALIRLVDLKTIVVPLTVETEEQHQYFIESACINVLIKDKTVRILGCQRDHKLLEKLRDKGHPGLILFSTGTTGRPKAILHDLTKFLKRYATPRPALRTVSFLLFDHIGGLNTLFHTLYNKGVVITPKYRSVESVLEVCDQYQVEALPTTPTFLRLMLLSGALPARFPKSLKVITYGTERMDQATLNELCAILPDIDFRQTFGMSELGIVRVKSVARDSLFMKIGGEGVETKVVDGVLYIKSETRMVGYLNANSPFDEDGWYNTNDLVETDGLYYKIVGRTSDVVNVAGLKFLVSEVERVALEYPNVKMVKGFPKSNPITGQHIELSVQPQIGSQFSKIDFINFLKAKLQSHMVPRRVTIEDITISHRFKRM